MRVKVRLQPAAADQGERLREIAIAAKASWGYDLERVRHWAAMGDFSPAGLRQKDVVVASVGTNAVGWIGVIRQQVASACTGTPASIIRRGYRASRNVNRMSTSRGEQAQPASSE